MDNTVVDKILLAAIGAMFMTRERAEEIFDDCFRRWQVEKISRDAFLDDLVAHSHKAHAELEELLTRHVKDVAIRKHHILTPPGFTLILKSMLIMDGVGERLKPKFNSMPILKEWLWRYRVHEAFSKLFSVKDAFLDAGDLFIKFPGHIGTLLKKLQLGQFHVNLHIAYLEELVHAVRYGALALILGALLLASGLLVHAPNQSGAHALGMIGYIVFAILAFIIIIGTMRRRF